MIFFSKHPNLFLTSNLTISYMKPPTVPVWLLPLQSQMSSIENVSYYLYTCEIDIKTVLMNWNHQLPKLLWSRSLSHRLLCVVAKLTKSK